jgi:hypothetical protein
MQQRRCGERETHFPTPLVSPLPVGSGCSFFLTRRPVVDVCFFLDDDFGKVIILTVARCGIADHGHRSIAPTVRVLVPAKANRHVQMSIVIIIRARNRPCGHDLRRQAGRCRVHDGDITARIQIVRSAGIVGKDVVALIFGQRLDDATARESIASVRCHPPSQVVPTGRNLGRAGQGDCDHFTHGAALGW